MRIVIKIGTSTLTYSTGRINIRRVEKLCKVISDIKNAGNEVILVSSGAIGMGVGKLALEGKPDDIPTKQAAAAVGQCELMYIYDREFSDYNHTIAQVLITNSDINIPDNHTNFQNTVGKLLDFGAIPIINENDTVSTEEIEIGDNDTLGAIVAVSINADLLIILSDIDGLYTKDPRTNNDAYLLTVVEEINDDIVAMGKGKGSALGTGGMRTKLNAASIAVDEGIDTIIANGKDPDILYDILQGKTVGTKFVGKKVN
ncbi:MAG: glutamate 5-kinase [Clostridia bacterium]|nr:glutamate 5-kinase [Clostridia bacterium]